MWLVIAGQNPGVVERIDKDIRGPLPSRLLYTREKAAYWDGRNEAGEGVASGIYFYTIQAGEFTAMRKMAVTR